MNKEQQELSEPIMETELPAEFDPEKVERLMPACGVDSTMRVIPHMVDIQDGRYLRYSDYDALLALHNASLERERELQAQLVEAQAGESMQAGHLWKAYQDSELTGTMTFSGWLNWNISERTKAEAQLLAKDALIASLKSERSKQNKAEGELLATGEKLAEDATK